MNWQNFSELRGKHAFLSPSQPTWLRYNKEKLISVYKNNLMKLKGTELHSYAEKAIELGRNQPKTKDTINMYINDCIKYSMRTEECLRYSQNCFGHADAISFEDNNLKIFDLKTGKVKAKMEQLLIYAALFCLMYRYNPKDINIELRIYQNREILKCEPKSEDIVPIMERIVELDDIIENLKEEGVKKWRF